MPAYSLSAEESQQRCKTLEAELRETVARHNRAQEELNWKTAFLEAQVNSTIDGIIVVDPQGRKILQNQRAAELFNIPRHIVDDPDDTLQLRWVTDMTRHPDQFIEKVVHLYSHPDEISHDEIELKNGTVLDRYSSPVTGKDGARYGRIWTFHDITQRKQAEKALREREEQLRAALWASGTGTFRWDIRSNELRCDAALDSLFGLFSGQTVRSLETFISAVHPDDRSAVVERCARCARDGADFDMEFRVIWPDGSVRWLDDKGKTGFDDAGKPLYMTGACVDITARKEVNEALRASEEKFRQLADNINDVFWMTSPDSQVIQYISPAYEVIWGRSAASLYAHPHQWVEAILPEEREEVFAVFAKLLSDVPTVSVEYRISRPDGTVRWIHDRGFQVRDAAGNLIRLTGIASDITARKKTEEAMQKQQAELRILFDLMPAMIWFKDTHNGILRVNQRVAIAAGIPIDEIEGRPTSEVYPEEAARFYADDLEVIRSGVPKLGHVESMRGHHGEDLWLETDKVPYCDQDGQVVGIVVMAQDITARKKGEAELEATHKQLLETSRLAGMAEVATGVLHNVGNVLNSVNVASSCLADNLRQSKAANLARVVALLHAHADDLGAYITSDPKGKKIPGYLAQLAEHLVSEQADNLKELAGLQKNIEHIKDIVNMQQGFARVSGLVELLQVADLMEDALRMNASSFTRHDITVIKEFADVPPVMVEKHKVLQILVNLLRNAKHACDDSARPDKRLTLRLSSDAEHVSIAVSDNGIGIPPENLTRIFAHGFTTKKHGHGFGLHSGALAAKEMGGSLNVHSDGLGHGATFTLKLPVEQKSRRKSPPHE